VLDPLARCARRLDRAHAAGDAAAQSTETLLDRLRAVPGLTAEERPALAPYRYFVVGAGYIPGTVDA
jgi:hypothetical protein